MPSQQGPYHHLYTSARWLRERKIFLQQNPLCSFHKLRNKVKPATVVDHKTQHKGDLELFWDQSNWQALCKHCHDSVKQRLEKSGTLLGCTNDGLPIDPNHHWNN